MWCVESDSSLLGMSLAGGRFGPWLGQIWWPNSLLLQVLFPACREVWFLLGLISGLVPSWFWDCNQLVVIRGKRLLLKAGPSWVECASEGAGSCHLYVPS